MSPRRAHAAHREPGGGPPPARPASPQRGVLAPSRHDPLVTAASEVIGGPAGSRLASARGVWRAVPLLVIMSVATMGLGVVERGHCLAKGWSTPDMFWHACYSDIAVRYGSARLGGPNRPGLVEALGPTGLDQSPLAGAAMWLVSGLVGGDGKHPERQFFDLSALLLAVALAVAVVAVGAVDPRRRWDAAHLALSPVVVTAGLVSYTLLAVALLALAWLAISRRRVVVGGVLLGLSMATAPQYATVACILGVVALRSGRADPAARGRTLAPALVAAATWLGVRVVLLPGATGQLAEGWRAWRSASPGYGSIWLVPQLLAASKPVRHQGWLADWWFAASSLGAAAATRLTVIGLVAVACLLLAFVLSRPSWAFTVSDGAAPLALAAVCGVLVVAKSLPVQTSVLLLPLIALSGLHWRDHLIWAGTECAYFVAVWLYIGGQYRADRALAPSFYLLLLCARLAGIAWIGIAGVRRAAAAGVRRRSPLWTAGAWPEPVDNDSVGGAWQASLYPGQAPSGQFAGP